MLPQITFAEYGRFPEVWLHEGIFLARAAHELFQTADRALKVYIEHIPYARQEDGRVKNIPPEKRPKNEFFPITMMLLGLATENICKGILVARDPSYIDEKSSKLSPKLTGHNLAFLISECKIELSKEEQEIIDKMFRHVIWKGRYPIPKSEANYDKVWGRYPHDIEQSLILFTKVWRILNAICQVPH